MKLTIKDIAKKAGVSTSTVSKALNNYSGAVSSDVKKRIEEIVKQENYQPNMIARSLRTKKTGTIGLIIPLPTESVITNPYFVETILTVEKTAKARGYHLIFSTFDTEEKEDAIISRMFDRSNFDGFLLMGSPVSDKYVKKLDESDVNVVFIGRYYGLKRIKFVDINNRQSAYEAVKYLLTLGHKKIAFVGGSSKFYNRRDREEGYRAALKEAGIEPVSGYIKEVDLSEASGRAAMQEFLTLREKPTAVLTHNDISAVGIIKAAQEKGLKVPGDISVVSFSDGSKLSETNPLLTTVRIPADKIASEATNKLVDLIENDFIENKNIELGTELVRRETTGEA